jgi:hypothetical protein
VNPMPAKRTLLFRAHQHTDPYEPGAYTWPTRRVLFNERLREKISVQDFMSSLGRHLGKTERETKTGKRAMTKFTSTSTRLGWTLHLTGKKSREQQEQGKDDHISFLIFDLQTLSEMPNVTVFRVSDALSFLESSGQASLIQPTYQQWARNCDEYIIMGRGIENAILQVIPWSELWELPIINRTFCSAYTLHTYERFRNEDIDTYGQIEYEDVCRMVVESAKGVAGQKANDVELVQHLVKLILKPGVWFWGIKTSSTDANIRDGCKAILDNELVIRMSQVSV